MSYQVFTISGSPRAWRVLLALIIKQLPFENHVLSASDGEQKTPEFTALNPRQRVPVLKDGDFVLTESIAILAYLDRKHPNPPLIGDDPKGAAQIWCIAMEGDHDLRDAAPAFLRPLFNQTADPADSALVNAATKMQAEHARLEALLGQSPWLAGEQLSLADIICFPEVRLLLRGIERSPQTMEALGFAPHAVRYPRIAAWVERIEALPGYELTFPAHWR